MLVENKIAIFTFYFLKTTKGQVGFRVEYGLELA